MPYYFLLISSWVALICGPIVLAVSGFLFLKKKSHGSKIGIVVGILLTVYALYLWVPEIMRSKEAYREKQEILKQEKSKTN